MFRIAQKWLDQVGHDYETKGHVNRELLNDVIVKLQFIQQDEDAIAWEEGAPDVRTANIRQA